MHHDKVPLTIVTPTYNRAYILDECYNSLKNQTVKAFIWMIIDDGSSDNTEELVKNWQSEGHINIVYYKKLNGGKASCLNFAFDRVKSKYVVCLDSDDQFTPKAVEMALQRLEKVENVNYCGGLLALRTSTSGIVMGGKQIPEGKKYITIPELANKYKIRSEIICFYITDKVTKYRFPEYENEKFVSPAYIDLKMSKKYKFLVSRESYCICEYLPDGLTKNKIEVIKKNPRGYTSVIRESFELSTNFVIKSKNCLMYIAGNKLAGERKIIRSSPRKIMTFFYYPLGILAYVYRFKLKK